MRKKHIKSSFTEPYDGLLEMNTEEYTPWTWVRDTREGMIKFIPNEVLRIQQHNGRDEDNFLWKRGKDRFNMNMILLGIYPHIFFIPIKRVRRCTTYWDGEDDYKLVDYSDYFWVKEILGRVKKPITKSSKREIKKLLIDEFKMFENENDIPYNPSEYKEYSSHIYFLNLLEREGIQYSKEYGVFFFESGRTFKEQGINSPTFVTDLSFDYSIVNPQLSNFKVNRFRSWYNNSWSGVVTFSIPKTILDKVIMSIPDRVADFFTSSREEEIPEPSDLVKIKAKGMDPKTAFRKM